MTETPETSKSPREFNSIVGGGLLVVIPVWIELAERKLTFNMENLIKYDQKCLKSISENC
jgi:hypothetical protein